MAKKVKKEGCMLEHLKNRGCVLLTGEDGMKLLNSLVTNELLKNDWVEKPLVYTALLTSNGRYLFDFFVLKIAEDVAMLDVHMDQKDQIIETINKFKLRSKVQIEFVADMKVFATSDKNIGVKDPRHVELGNRIYDADLILDFVNISSYQEHRIKLGIPEYPYELIQEKTIILEMNFEELSGISFNKGCYVGQELMARTKHLGQIRKRLFVLEFSEGNPKYGDVVFNENSEEVGTIFSTSDKYCLAFLYIEKITKNLRNANLTKFDKVCDF